MCAYQRVRNNSFSENFEYELNGWPLRPLVFGRYKYTIKIEIINPFVPNAPSLYPLKTSENLTIFWCFQEVEKGCIGNKWVNGKTCIFKRCGKYLIVMKILSYENFFWLNLDCIFNRRWQWERCDLKYDSGVASQRC